MLTMPEPREPVVCPACSATHEDGIDFCARCGAPVGRFTTLDPYKVFFATGWILRRSATARIRLIVLLGMWVLLGIPVAAMVAYAIVRPEGSHALRLLEYGLVSLIYAAILIRVTRNYINNRPKSGPYDPGR